MELHTISATAEIAAPADRLYGLIADYHDGHQRILPKPPFVSLDVEQGGVGAGSHIRVVMRVLGRNQTFRATVAEPEPGRVLVETTDTGMITTFSVVPHANQAAATVTIATTMTVRAGMVGKLQAWLFTRLLQPTYVKELAHLAAVAKQETDSDERSLL